MEVILELFNFILHIDQYLADFSSQYGLYLYLILFVIIFCETGLVFAPFLPGDSLLFAAGALVANEASGLSIVLLYGLLLVAAIVGDFVNYNIGKHFGSKITQTKLIKEAHLKSTEAFFEKYGTKTIFMARFFPIARTFAPFMAGMAKMPWRQFSSYNVIGGFAWVTVFLYAGYFFGNIPFVKANFSLVVVGIIVLSVIPLVVEFIKIKKRKTV
jgi:membrane-associated protein